MSLSELGVPNRIVHRTGDKPVKCVIWDLDETLWKGTLLEDKEVSLRPGVRGILITLDERGILHSIASRNDYETTMGLLQTLGIDGFFLHPQIGWGAKSEAVKNISRELNIGLDSLLFVDDQEYERDEVQLALPEVRVCDALAIADLLGREDLNPKAITDDSRFRRKRYQSDIAREAAQKEFVGPSEEFLASLNMVLTIHPAEEGDLERAEELTIRTNQLNATGVTYSYAELDAFRSSSKHSLLMADLTDRYGDSGKIGLALLDLGQTEWTIRLMLMSCRVMSRGIGTIFLRELIERAQHAGVKLLADFIPTDRNRMMLVSYKFAGFVEHSVYEGRHLLVHDGTAPMPRPRYARVDLCF
jgi:FkbH-like protein